MSYDIILTGQQSNIAFLLSTTDKTFSEIAEETNTTIQTVYDVDAKVFDVEYITGNPQFLKRQGDRLVIEALKFFPDNFESDYQTAVQIAIWTAQKIRSTTIETSKCKYWDKVIEYLKTK